MRLVLIRHAEAAPGEPDELRVLTPGGRLRADGLVPDALLSSPLLRGRETAAELGFGDPEASDALAPGATADGVRTAAAGRGETVFVVGHQPDCSRIAAALAGGPEPAFPPAGMQVLEL